MYENLPRRLANGRWAYDSLRASHKFQWNPHSKSTTNQTSRPPKSTLDESSDEVTMNSTFNTSFNTSFNSSSDVEMNPRLNVPDKEVRIKNALPQSASDAEDWSPQECAAKDSNGSQPAALSFWKELQSQQQTTSRSESVSCSRTGSRNSSADPSASPSMDPNDSDSPFRLA